MIPHGTPEAACSARRVSWANSTGSPSKPRASATATSRAALEDRPAPTGRSVVTCPVKPTSGLSSSTTPATYRAQPETDAGSAIDREIRASAPSVSLVSTTSVPPR